MARGRCAPPGARYPQPAAGSLPAVHILVMTDRDWTHPQGGGTGANLYGQVSRWLAWGHRVSIVVCRYEGCERARALWRRSRSTASAGARRSFPRMIWRGMRGRLPEADVVLEVVNGITFLSPLWLRTPSRHAGSPRAPRATTSRRWAAGRSGRAAAGDPAAEAALRGSRFSTISEATADEMVEQLGSSATGSTSTTSASSWTRSPPACGRSEPTLLVPRAASSATSASRSCWTCSSRSPRRCSTWPATATTGGARGRDRSARADRPGAHARPRGEATQARAAAARVGQPDRVLGRGLVPDRHGGRGLLHAQRRPGRRRPARVDPTATAPGCWPTTPEELALKSARPVHDREPARVAWAPSALERAGPVHVGRRRSSARCHSLEAAGRRPAAERPAIRCRARTPAARRAWPPRSSPPTWSRCCSPSSSRALLGADDYGSLAALLSAFIILMVPGSALQIAVAREISTRSRPRRPAPRRPGVRRWLSRLALATCLVAAAAIPLREPLAAAINVDQSGPRPRCPCPACSGCCCPWSAAPCRASSATGRVGFSLVGEATLRLIVRRHPRRPPASA